MSKFKSLLQNNPLSLLFLGFVLALIFVLGFGLSITSALVSIYDKNLIEHDICFNGDCVKRLLQEIEPALGIAKGAIDFGVAIATIGGIFVALLSYLSSANNAALTNHIEHLKIFAEYIESEVKKRDRLSYSNFDTLLLYGKIFNQSRVGKTTVSDGYRVFISDLNNVIEESNERCIGGTPGGFSYKDHQRRIRDHLCSLGIVIYAAPRNDYFEMENQLFSLLHRLNQSFCPPGVLPDIAARKYY